MTKLEIGLNAKGYTKRGKVLYTIFQREGQKSLLLVSKDEVLHCTTSSDKIFFEEVANKLKAAKSKSHKFINSLL